MSARAKASQVVYLSAFADELFLKSAAETLERLVDESREHGRGLLSSLLEIAREEAEDALKTSARTAAIGSRRQEDDGAAELAKKFAYRKGSANPEDEEEPVEEDTLQAAYS